MSKLIAYLSLPFKKAFPLFFAFIFIVISGGILGGRHTVRC